MSGAACLRQLDSVFDNWKIRPILLPETVNSFFEHRLLKWIYPILQKGFSMPKPTRQILEDSLIVNPNDLATHFAYADLLMEEGDPRGEFIQIQLALEEESKSPQERDRLKAREREILDQHEATWLGPLAPYLLGSEEDRGKRHSLDHEFQDREYYETPIRVDYHWHRGWLDFVTFHEVTLNMIHVFASLPFARLVQDFTLLDNHSSPFSSLDESLKWPSEREFDVLDVLAESDVLQNVKKFQFGATADPDDKYQNSGVGMRDPKRIVDRMPKIEELRIYAQCSNLRSFAKMHLDHLRILLIYHSFACPLKEFAANPSLGNLTHFLYFPHTYTGEDNDNNNWVEALESYVPLHGVEAFVKSPYLKKLTHLQLRSSSMGDEGIRAIIESGILKRLKILDLRHGCVTDQGALLLAKCPEIKNLELLDLMNNRLTEDGIRDLKGCGIHVKINDQQSEPFNDEDYLFVGDGE